MPEVIKTLKFSLSSYWRIGSGKGSGAIADALVLRDGNGLPIIPGKAIKGLLRDALSLATVSGSVDPDRVVHWFGSALPISEEAANSQEGDDQEVQLEEGRFASHEGRLWFGTAQLSPAWQGWAKEQGSSEGGKDILNSLFAYQSSTAIDEKGIAQEHSLRVAEVAVPMDLHAQVRGPNDDQSWITDLQVAVPLLRALGSRRSRGLGRVDVTLEEAK